MAITITQGTQTDVKTTTDSGAEIQHVRLDGGTIASIPGIGGTVSINNIPEVSVVTASVLGTAGGSAFGTLSTASGAGTKHYVTGLSVIGQSGSADIRVLSGTAIAGTGVLGAGWVVPGGGFIRDFSIPVNSGTNSELTYHFVGAGTAFIAVNYFKTT